MTDRPTLGGLEARSALAGVAAMTGNLEAGREHVAAMRRLADQLPNDGPTGPYPRTVNFDIFVEARGGRPEERRPGPRRGRVGAGQDSAVVGREPDLLRPRHGRAGDVQGAAAHALDAIRTVPWAVHTLAMAASDVLTAVPRDNRTDEVQELRRYASKVPGPWETR